MDIVMPLHPPLEPHRTGMLKTGQDQIYWEECGNPAGKPAVVLHGGPGSGCTAWNRRLFDPARYRVVLFDQRNCGRSLPAARDFETNLRENRTENLVEDIERLRTLLGIERWLVLGGSWGSTLALAYAESHPARVSEMVLFGVSTGQHTDLDWLFRGGLRKLFPAEWDRLVASLPESMRNENVVESYSRLLEDPNPQVRASAAAAWCLWESATPSWPPTTGLSPRFQVPDFAYAFARIVTHFVSNNLWLEDGILLRKAPMLAAIPSVLVNGQFDFQSPIENAWDLHKLWPNSELRIVESAGHGGNDGIDPELVRATDKFLALAPAQTDPFGGN